MGTLFRDPTGPTVSFLDRVRECNKHDLAKFRPLFADDVRVGWLRDETIRLLSGYSEVFEVRKETVRLSPLLTSYEARSEAVGAAMRDLKDKGHISGWRGEIYPVKPTFGMRPLFELERAAVPLLGIRAFGVHMNGIVRQGSNIKMWVGRRSKHKPTFPGMLDNMVAGGQPIGLSLIDNLVKECGEEANIPPDLAHRAVPVGAVSYVKEMPEGLKPDVQFCFDLELSADFTPKPMDDEIEYFELWPIEKVMEVVSTTAEFKYNCNLVIIDFLIRNGLIPPDDPDYLAIVQGLHR